MEQKKIEARKFFTEMEQNILKKADPNYKKPVEVPPSELFDFDELSELPDQPALVRRGSIGGIRLQRTISSIDGKLINNLILFIYLFIYF